MTIGLRKSIIEANLEAFQSILSSSKTIDLNEHFDSEFGNDNQLPAPYQDWSLPKLASESSLVIEVVAMLGLLQSRSVHKRSGVLAKDGRQRLQSLISMLSSLFSRGATLPIGGPRLLEYLLVSSRPGECLFNQKQIMSLTRLFLKQGYDPNDTYFIEGSIIHPLAYCYNMQINFTAILKLYVSFGFNVESDLTFERSPLMLAIYASNFSATKFLLDQGATLNRRGLVQASMHFQMEQLKPENLNFEKKSSTQAFGELVNALSQFQEIAYEPLSIFAGLALTHYQMLVEDRHLDLDKLVEHVLPTAWMKRALRSRFPNFRREWRERLNHLSLEFYLLQQAKLPRVTIDLIKSYHEKYEPIACLDEVKRGVFFQRVGGVTQLSKASNTLKSEHPLWSSKNRLEKAPSTLSEPD